MKESKAFLMGDFRDQPTRIHVIPFDMGDPHRLDGRGLAFIFSLVYEYDRPYGKESVWNPVVMVNLSS